MLADIVLIIHFILIAFMLAGILITPLAYKFNLTIFKNFRLRALHLTLMVFITLEVLVGIQCPLTFIERIFRGLKQEHHSFLGEWISQLIYWNVPGEAFLAVYSACLIWVCTMWKIFPPKQ